jgi:hypothetical protein
MLSFSEMAKLTNWVTANRTRVEGMTRAEAVRAFKSETKVVVSHDALKAAEEAIGITRNRGNAGRDSARKDRSSIIARSIVTLYTKLGEAPPIELQDIAAGQ